MTQAEPGKPAGLGSPRPPPWWKTLRADAPFLARTLIGLGMVGLIIAVWWAMTRGSALERYVSPEKVPSPGEVFHNSTVKPSGPTRTSTRPNSLSEAIIQRF